MGDPSLAIFRNSVEKIAENIRKDKSLSFLSYRPDHLHPGKNQCKQYDRKSLSIRLHSALHIFFSIYNSTYAFFTRKELISQKYNV